MIIPSQTTLIKGRLDTYSEDFLNHRVAFVAGYRNIVNGKFAESGEFRGTIRFDFDATVVSSQMFPGSEDAMREITYINLHNDSPIADLTLTARLWSQFQESSIVALFRVTLEPRWTAHYLRTTGWIVYNENGLPVRAA